MNSFTIDGEAGAEYRFDEGPSLLLLPDVYKETLKNVGAEGAVEFKKVTPFYRCFFEEDGSYVDITDDDASMQQSLQLLEGQSGGWNRFQNYMKVATDYLNFGLPNVIEEKLDFEFFTDFVTACLKFFPLRSQANMLSKYFTSAKTQAMMSFQALYVGLSPYESPAIFSLLQALEFDKGIYYPVGGFKAVTQALVDAAEDSGVKMCVNTQVQSIHELSIRQKQSYIESMTVSQTSRGGASAEVISADMFISNMDAPQAERSLLGPAIHSIHTIQKSEPNAAKHTDMDANIHKNGSADMDSDTRTAKATSVSGGSDVSDVDLIDRRTESARSSCPVLSLHFALNRTLPGLTHHSLFLSADYKGSWAVVEGTRETTQGKESGGGAFNPQAMNFYVHAPCRTDPTACPTGHDAVTVLVPIPLIPKDIQNAYVASQIEDGKSHDGISEEEYAAYEKELVARVRRAVIARMDTGIRAVDSSFGSMANYVVAEKAVTATEWRDKYHLNRGSVFGLAHSLDQLSVFRPRIRHPRVGNMYRVGASTKPGNGVPLVMIGARLTADAVMKDMNDMKDRDRRRDTFI
jgi:phytoene desaturase (3,4-didehydrolycopene-forming)